MTVIFVFPGQGSQKVGMGLSLFDLYPNEVAQADSILGYSIKKLCLEGPPQKLLQTEFTQPAIYVVNSLAYLQLVRENGMKPDYLAGHSIGEYTALFAAGVFDFATGLKLVQKRGELMSAITDGGMAAVIGLSAERIKAVLDEDNISTIDLANFNAPDQIVIAGSRQDIQNSIPLLRDGGAKMVIPLNVSGPFHSRLMRPARKSFEKFLNNFSLSPPQIPVISNLEGKPYDPSKLHETLSQQIDRPVLWQQSVEFLLAKPDLQFKEIGSKSVLTELIEKTRHAFSNRAEPALPTTKRFLPEKLGSEEFRQDHRVRYAYVAGSMVKGIASTALVTRMAKKGLLSFFGTGGLTLEEIEEALARLQAELGDTSSFGMNLLANYEDPAFEEKTVALYLDRGVKRIEAAAFLQVTPALVWFRVKGLKENPDGSVEIPHKILSKVSHPDLARAFLSPPPPALVDRLFKEGKITESESHLVSRIPMSEDICVEADSAGHTDKGVALVLVPTMVRLRDEMAASFGYRKKIRIGAAGGLGTPEALAAAFILGADFVLTGSINQCTVDAGTSPAVKDLLQKAGIQDMAMAPAGDMFEMGSKVQVLKKGVFFPARAQKLFDLYRQYDSIDQIDSKTREQIEQRFFRKTFEEVYMETKEYYRTRKPSEIEKAEVSPKHKMALIFRWYFGHSNRLALEGVIDNQVDFQIHCGPAMGAFNQWVKGTHYEDWRSRYVDEIALLLMEETARFLNRRFEEL